MSTTQQGIQFREGYLAAQRFYGEGARYALQQIGGEVERLRAEYPNLPYTAEARIARIESLAAQDRGVIPEVCNVDD